MARSRDLSNILDNVVRMTPMVIGADRCVMLARSQMGKDEVSIYHYGLSDDELRRISDGDWPYYDELQRLAQAGQAAMVTRGEKWSGALKNRVTLIEGDEPLLALPLMAKGVYAGVLVVTYHGVPERFAERWLRILTGIASQSATAIENDWLHRQDLERERMERELDVAHEIQASFLPAEVPPMPGWEVATMWRAARQVAGDFYDLIPLPDHRVGVLIADVADKGVPAALFMALSRTLIKAIALSGRPANVVLERANNLILADAASDMFVTTFYGVVDLNVHRLSYASGGHNPALLVRAGDGEVVLLKPYGMALGIIENIEMGLDSVDIEAGDVLVLYTDGITEAIDDTEQEFGMERLIDVVQRARGEPAEAIIRAVTEALESHVRGEPPFDDATMMVLKRVCE